MLLKKIVFAVIPLLLGGCIPSLHPFYTENSIVFEEKLVGEWQQDNNLWNFQMAKDANYYELTIHKKEKTSDFKVVAFKVEDDLYLDFYPGDDPNIQEIEFYKIHILPVHTAGKVSLDENTFKLEFLNPEAIGKLLKEKPELVKHEIINKNKYGQKAEKLILTDNPKDLQKFIKENRHIDEFYLDEIDFERVMPEKSGNSS